MKIILQRVSKASVIINDKTPESIGHGLVALVGFRGEDLPETVDYMLAKMVNLRIFNDEDGNFNYSLMDVSGELLVVSNFTLYANSKKGRRPSFTQAAPPNLAIPLYDYMIARLRETTIPFVTGEFGANMQVSLTNDGPVTIDLDSDELIPTKE